MKILGIETSCDETSVSVVKDGVEILSNIVSSQIQAHAGFGGVVPELAAREHLKNIHPVVEAALQEANCSVSDMEAIAVTNSPGLVPALLVGVSYAKGLAAASGLPVIGVNHFLAHVYGAFLDHSEQLLKAESYPILALVVSGGHTNLLLVEENGEAHIIGRTLDDAAGEAFDKAAKILNLGYPGGPVIDRLAKEGNPQAVHFPRALTGGGGRPEKKENRLNFSFSGVKTALLYHVKDREMSDQELKDTVSSYQEAVVDVLVLKAMRAAKHYKAGAVVMCGGVACNSRLRLKMKQAFNKIGREPVVAKPCYCTDNAAMVAGYGYHCLKQNRVDNLSLGVNARLPLDLGKAPFVPETLT